MHLVQTLRSVMRFRRLKLNSDKRVLQRNANVADLRATAERRLPRGVFDSIDGGAKAELSLRRNVEAVERLEFRPRIMTAVAGVDPSTTLLGKPLPIPLVPAPTGFTRIVSPRGGLDVAEAAARAGVPYTFSTLSTRSIAEVAAISDGPKWFRVYVWKDRALVSNLLKRAAACGYEAIVLTADTAVIGRGERDIRHCFTMLPKLAIATLFDGMAYPGWRARIVRNDAIAFANISGTGVPDGSRATDLLSYVNAQFDQLSSWRDLDWFRENRGRLIVLKGVQTVEDAKLAADCGVDAVALSNHGGRQVDGSPAIAGLIGPLADPIGGRSEIICNGGVRRGSDIVTAVALGARACMSGRAYLYGLCAAGQFGVQHVLALLDGDIGRTMALTGKATIAGLARASSAAARLNEARGFER